MAALHRVTRIILIVKKSIVRATAITAWKYIASTNKKFSAPQAICENKDSYYTGYGSGNSTGNGVLFGNACVELLKLKQRRPLTNKPKAMRALKMSTLKSQH